MFFIIIVSYLIKSKKATRCKMHPYFREVKNTKIMCTQESWLAVHSALSSPPILWVRKQGHRWARKCAEDPSASWWIARTP